ncbi:type II secretion system major pseudopilin GspG [Beggiatoa leptomitoformis]|uniref:Type II secretion system core protein G n=2 Tax=Beggiatoa leptomitoformis TaxID=288004 RepID=A0A2N9YCL4_9GAMM|nr:type II secretion system major pseudopilin GspG [Beggiatoa leptomitoformis]ALG66502.1 type II secretion system major pseudopilin GspG [Beggiatoa leptomitoformis]AUI68203.1 type II secretion system major pseudopilin GspG [Beggiatoa leptomitoformis]
MKVRQQQGFTLIEVMVVIVILSILATLVVPSIMGRTADARQTKTRHDIHAIEAALKLYKLDNYVYPSTDQGLEALVNRPMTTPEPRKWKEGGYLERLPIDAWGSPYQYMSPGVHGEIDIWSLGADKQPDGTGENMDIGNWSQE